MFSAFNPAWETTLENSWRRLGGLLRSVYTSRFPPRPLAGQRLEAARQQLEAWKPPPQSSWRWLGASKTSPGELLESSWRLLESLGGILGGLEGVLGGAGAVLEAYKARLGRSLGRLGAILGALEAMLQPPGGQKASKIGPQKGPKSIGFGHRFRDRFWVRFGHPQIMKNHTGA